MKKNNYFASVAMLSILSTFGFISCQQDNDVFDTQSKTNEKESQIEVNDSVFTFVPDFQCGNGGPASIDNTIEVPNMNLGLNVDQQVLYDNSGIATRGCIENFISSEVSGIFKYGAEKIFGYYFSKNAAPIYNVFFGDKGAAETAARLNDINCKISQIQNVMAKMEKAITNTNVTTMLRERARFNTFATHTVQKYEDFLNAKDSVERDEVIRCWGDEITDDSNSYNTAIQYLEFLYSRYNSLNFYLPQLYDYWVYQTTAWEHEGLELRANLRRSDAALAETAYIMTKAYCSIESCEQSSIDADNAYKKVQEIYKRFENVSYHPNAVVCQIQGANVIMNKNLVMRDMKNHPWMQSESEWSSIKDFMYGETDHNADYVLNHSLTENDVKTIYNFYNNDRKEKMTFEQIMQSLGFNLEPLQADKRHVMTLATGASMENEHFYNRNYYFKFDKVAVVNESDYLKDNFSIGLMWLDRNWKFDRIFKWWDNYTSDDCQYFRIETERYNGDTAYTK